MSPFDELRVLYLQGDLVVFAGSIVSQSGGLPAWPALIRRALAEARVQASPLHTYTLDTVDAALGCGDVSRALSTLQDVMSAEGFDRVVARALDDGPLPIPRLARAIAGLDPTLHAVVTTNRDQFIERAFGGRWSGLSSPRLAPGAQRHDLLPVQGARIDLGFVILHERDPTMLLRSHPELRGSLERLFDLPSLFVGYGPSDPDFERLCGLSRAAGRCSVPRRFALMPTSRVDWRARDVLARVGVEVLEYADPGGSHAELERILGELAASRSLTARSSPLSARANTGRVARATDDSTTAAPSEPPLPPPLAVLCALMQSVFTDAEIRRFIGFLPGAAGLDAYLPGPHASLAVLAFEAVRLLERHGLLTDGFFKHLRSDRPGRSGEIEAVRALVFRSRP